eukprot:7259266-Pyramimonas_sp.AAC.1
MASLFSVTSIALLGCAGAAQLGAGGLPTARESRAGWRNIYQIRNGHERTCHPIALPRTSATALGGAALPGRSDARAWRCVTFALPLVERFWNFRVQFLNMGASLGTSWGLGWLLGASLGAC